MCKVIAVTNRMLCQGDFLEQIRILGRAGVDQIVLREKDLAEHEYEALAREVLSVCQDCSVICSLHQNIETARLLQAKSLHLSLPLAKKYRREIKGFDWLGISTHSLQQVRDAIQCGADYVFYGHVFATDCKKNIPPRGLKALGEICRGSEIPVYAIGGISPENALLAVDAGASGVCVMSWAMKQDEETIRAFVKRCHGALMD